MTGQLHKSAGPQTSQILWADLTWMCENLQIPVKPCLAVHPCKFSNFELHWPSASCSAQVNIGKLVPTVYPQKAFNLHLFYCRCREATWRDAEVLRGSSVSSVSPDLAFLQAATKSLSKMNVVFTDRCTVTSCVCTTCQNKTGLTLNTFKQKFHEHQTKAQVKNSTFKLNVFINCTTGSLLNSGL